MYNSVYPMGGGEEQHDDWGGLWLWSLWENIWNLGSIGRSTR